MPSTMRNLKIGSQAGKKRWRWRFESSSGASLEVKSDDPIAISFLRNQYPHSIFRKGHSLAPIQAGMIRKIFLEQVFQVVRIVDAFAASSGHKPSSSAVSGRAPQEITQHILQFLHHFAP